jgi:hypothetical protein
MRRDLCSQREGIVSCIEDPNDQASQNRFEEERTDFQHLEAAKVRLKPYFAWGCFAECHAFRGLKLPIAGDAQRVGFSLGRKARCGIFATN